MAVRITSGRSRRSTKRPRRDVQARVEDTIRLLEQGRLDIPAGGDPIAFILSDGKRTGKKSSSCARSRLGT